MYTVSSPHMRPYVHRVVESLMYSTANQRVARERGRRRFYHDAPDRHTSGSIRFCQGTRAPSMLRSVDRGAVPVRISSVQSFARRRSVRFAACRVWTFPVTEPGQGEL
eukprot:3045128-Prymnesium_polylepis.1